MHLIEDLKKLLSFFGTPETGLRPKGSVIRQVAGEKDFKCHLQGIGQFHGGEVYQRLLARMGRENFHVQRQCISEFQLLKRQLWQRPAFFVACWCGFSGYVVGRCVIQEIGFSGPSLAGSRAD